MPKQAFPPLEQSLYDALKAIFSPEGPLDANSRRNARYRARMHLEVTLRALTMAGLRLADSGEPRNNWCDGMRRAAELVEEQRWVFANKHYAAKQPMMSMVERNACQQCLHRINDELAKRNKMEVISDE